MPSRVPPAADFAQQLDEKETLAGGVSALTISIDWSTLAFREGNGHHLKGLGAFDLGLHVVQRGSGNRRLFEKDADAVEVFNTRDWIGVEQHQIGARAFLDRYTAYLVRRFVRAALSEITMSGIRLLRRRRS